MAQPFDSVDSQVTQVSRNAKRKGVPYGFIKVFIKWFNNNAFYWSNFYDD